MPPDPNGQQDSSLYPADHDAAFKFLGFIFDGVGDGFAEFQYFSSGRRPKKLDQPTYLNLPLEQAQVASEVLKRNGQMMITVGVAPRCRIPGKGRTGRNQDVLQVGCIWAKLDNAEAQDGAIDVIRRIKDFPLRPSVVVNSGYGYHIYFVFHAPLRGGELVVWSELIRDLRVALRVDTKVNLSEVMRLPGSLNIKEVHSISCDVWEEQSSWARYSLEEVRRAIDKVPSRLPLAVPMLSVEALQARGLNVDVIDAVVTGRGGVKAGSRYEGEAGRDFWIASELLEKNFNEEEVKAIFRTYTKGCGSNWARKRNREKYLELILSKAQATQVSGGVWQEDANNTLESELPSGYALRDGSIWFHPPVLDTDKKPPKAVKISDSFIRIAEIQESIDTGEISLSIAFDYLGKTRFVPILRSEMADSRKLVAALAGVGAPVTSNNARLVTAYLAGYEHSFASTIPHKRVTSRFGRGRSGGPFFFPGLNSTVEFAPSGSGDAALYRAYSSRRGSMVGWLEVMHSLCESGVESEQQTGDGEFAVAMHLQPLTRTNARGVL
jgi:hypothetical protein